MFTSADDRALGIPIETAPYPEGEAGIQKSIGTMCRMIREGASTAIMKSYAGNLLKQNGMPESTEQRCIVALEHLHANVSYAPDALGTEQIQIAPITLCVPGAVACIPIEDCDGLSVALGTLLAAMGIEVVVVRQFFGMNHQQHVLIEAKLDDGRWFPLDPSSKTMPAGRKARAVRETRHSPYDAEVTGAAESAQFVGMGKLPVWVWGNNQWNLYPEDATLETGLGHPTGVGFNPLDPLGLLSKFDPQIAWIGTAFKLIDSKGRDFETAKRDARARAESKDWTGNPSDLKWDLLALIVSSLINAVAARSVPSLGEPASNSLMNEWVLLARQLGYDNQSAKDTLDKLKKTRGSTTAYVWVEVLLILGAAVVGVALVAILVYLVIDSGERIIEYYLAGKANEDERIRLHEEKNKIVERHLDGSLLTPAEKQTLDFDESQIRAISPPPPPAPKPPEPFSPWPYILGVTVVGGVVLAVMYHKEIGELVSKRRPALAA